MLGRIVHFGVDAALFSALLAGVKRSSGFTPDIQQLPDPTVRSVAEKYLGLGEFLFDSSVAAAHASKYFGHAAPTSTSSLPPGLDRLEQPKQASPSSGWWK